MKNSDGIKNSVIIENIDSKNSTKKEPDSINSGPVKYNGTNLKIKDKSKKHKINHETEENNSPKKKIKLESENSSKVEEYITRKSSNNRQMYTGQQDKRKLLPLKKIASLTLSRNPAAFLTMKLPYSDPMFKLEEHVLPNLNFDAIKKPELLADLEKVHPILIKFTDVQWKKFCQKKICSKETFRRRMLQRNVFSMYKRGC